jgi:protein gp37
MTDGPLDGAYSSRMPKRYFIGSMTDMFHENAPAEEVQTLVNAMSLMPHHIFMLLTKRPERAKELLNGALGIKGYGHIWLGVTICNQAEADEKIPVLLETPAVKRFVSVEPMLGPVDIGKYLYGSYECALSCGTRKDYDYLPEVRCISCGFEGPDDYETWGNGNSRVCPECHNETDFDEVCPDCGTYMVTEHPDTPYIDWVICGAETGPGKRRMELEWALSLRDQCRRYFSKTPFFFKKDSAGVRLLDGREWNEVPV